MSTSLIEIAEEALEQKLKEISLAENAVEQKENADEATEQQDGQQVRSRKPRISEEERRALWEKAQAAKKIISTGVTGTVKWYSVLNRYGFIARADVEEDIFVHQTAIAKSSLEKYYLRTLLKDEKLVFDIVEGEKGLEAANVTGPGGENVIGSRAFRILLNKGRRRGAVRSNDESKTEEDSAVEKKGRRSSRNGAKKVDNEGGDGDKKAEDGEKKERTRRRRVHRRSPRKDKTAPSKASDDEVPEREEAGSRRRAGSQSPSLTAARCDSSLSGHDVALGAAPLDAQI